MKKYRGYLLDLDGTMYAGTRVIEGAKEFIEYLSNHNLPYLFVTNNASKRPDEVAEKLTQMGFVATADNVVTSAMATASYIAAESPGATVYVIGGTGIRQALTDEGLVIKDSEHVDYVVIGLDVDINYEKLSTACLAVRNGAKFISTNPDTSIPTERGFLPGNGALTSVITVSTGVEPKFIGKPMETIMNKAVDIIKLPKEEIVMIGDLYMTDIMSGINAGIDTLHVQTGVSTYEQVMAEQVPPTYSVKNLMEVINLYEQ
ncbi:TIGR01457 family HAD-type hydrolase [Macrococcus armenti]|uniref:TIGR01457 family HAD-type hydrolase n=1 Tax=Macrococcus armenti TaxID=2875764 RepID=UPI001CC9D4AD|nr:TIGR01457 family HAD-type hydrolase [Macrococcus armenti]UBH16001.1 TIGR01457 family HAD-type hydrolase [Macrococcus armenti]UBH18362.1 TIGR01457 family HAD-type hydrolase [Macrococcus armenti]UBH20628.1 TIGR01457 family HAD-type hydrolase [Macrococcus armenti]